MNKRIPLLLALLAAASAQAGNLDLLPAQAGDLQPSALAAPSAPSTAALAAPRAAVSFSWAASGAVADPAAPQAHSRETYFEASADELARGVTLHTTAPRALVRLQPLGETGPREALAIHPQSLTLTAAGGKSYAQGEGMEMLVAADKLAKAGLPFAPGTSAFRVHPSLGSGPLTLKAEGLSGSQRYLVNVVEPDSPYVLSMRTDAPHYLHGATVNVTPELLDTSSGGRAALAKIEGSIVSPAGRSFPLQFRPGKDGRMQAALPLDADEEAAPGLWEVRAQGSATVKGQRVDRSIRLAFSAALPTARLTRAASVESGPEGVRLRLGVEAAAAGRYELRALVYGTVAGKLQLLAVADGAQWLEAGTGDVALDFKRSLLAGAAAPYEIRDLTLLEQTRMAVLQRQRRALVLGDSDLPRNAQLSLAPEPAAPVHVKR